MIYDETAAEAAVLKKIEELERRRRSLQMDRASVLAVAHRVAGFYLAHELPDSGQFMLMLDFQTRVGNPNNLVRLKIPFVGDEKKITFTTAGKVSAEEVCAALDAMLAAA